MNDEMGQGARQGSLHPHKRQVLLFERVIMFAVRNCHIHALKTGGGGCVQCNPRFTMGDVMWFSHRVTRGRFLG